MTDEQKAVAQVATPRTDAATYPGWIKVDDGTDTPWHTDRQEWTKAEVARQLERELTAANAERDKALDNLRRHALLVGRLQGQVEDAESRAETAERNIANAIAYHVGLTNEQLLRAEAAESLVSAAPPEGMVEVPVEPTEAMLRAALDNRYTRSKRSRNVKERFPHGYEMWMKVGLVRDAPQIADEYKAMIAARPVAAPLREQIIEECIAALRQASFCLRTYLPDEPDAQMTVRMVDRARRALSAAPNNAGEEKPVHSAIATSECPDRASGDRGTQELIAEIDALAEKATPGPWAWDQRGEKTNEWGLGIAMRADDSPIAGHFDDEDAIYVEGICSNEAAALNYADPALICALRNAWPRFRDALKTASSANGNAVAGESPDARDANDRRYKWLRSTARPEVRHDHSGEAMAWYRLPSITIQRPEDVTESPDGFDAAVDAAMGSPDEERK